MRQLFIQLGSKTSLNSSGEEGCGECISIFKIIYSSKFGTCGTKGFLALARLPTVKAWKQGLCPDVCSYLVPDQSSSSALPGLLPADFSCQLNFDGFIGSSSLLPWTNLAANSPDFPSLKIFSYCALGKHPKNKCEL